MTPHFASLVNPIIHHVLDLTARIKGGERVDLKSARYAIRNLFRQSEEQASRLQGTLPQNEFLLAQQALVYWTDEVLTLADHNWIEMTLEWEYFNSQDRAWKFYFDGELKARKSSGDVIELWYLAMVLGFEGDIIEGFAKLNRNDFPPANVSEEEARQLWARELERQIPARQTQPELVRPALVGNVLPLRGTSFLITTLQWAGALFLLFCVLIVLKLYF